MNDRTHESTLRWGGERLGLVHGEPIGLSTWAGERLHVVVGPNEVALVNDDGGNRAVLLEGNHLVCVLREGEEPGDLDDRELSSRLGIERDDLFRVRRQVRLLASADEILFVTVSTLQVMSFGEESPIVFADHEHGLVDLDIAGAFRLVVVDPVLFHESFLRNSGDLARSDFERIAVAVVQGALTHALEHAYDSIDRIDRDLQSLAVRLMHELQPSLRHVGLALDELEVTRLHTPVGLARASEASPATVRTPG